MLFGFAPQIELASYSPDMCQILEEQKNPFMLAFDQS